MTSYLGAGSGAPRAQPMGKLVEDRGEHKPSLDFPHFRPTSV